MSDRFWLYYEDPRKTAFGRKREFKGGFQTAREALKKVKKVNKPWWTIVDSETGIRILRG